MPSVSDLRTQILANAEYLCPNGNDRILRVVVAANSASPPKYCAVFIYDGVEVDLEPGITSHGSMKSGEHATVQEGLEELLVKVGKEVGRKAGVC